jgi:hypothetical protein
VPRKDVPHSPRNARHENRFPATLGGAHYDDYQWSYEECTSARRSRMAPSVSRVARMFADGSSSLLRNAPFPAKFL